MRTELNNIGFVGCSNANKPKINTIKQNNIKLDDSHAKNTVKYSTDNLKANYMVSFKGNITGEASSTGNIGTLNHETHFFREPKTDEIVQYYVLNNFSNDSKINVVSGACSTGEEAKSYAMMLDSLGNKLHVFGFDISDDVVKQADNDIVRLLVDSDLPDLSCLGANSFDSEKFITDDDYSLDPYQKECKEKFKTYYIKLGELYKVPVHPDAQKQLDGLNELINDKEKYDKARKEYDEKINELKEKNASGEIEDELGMLDCFPSFDETINLSKTTLEQQCNLFYTFQNYKVADGAFDNCSFKQGNVLKLEQLYKPNSINVLLYRNALYHTLCHGNSLFRIMNEDAQETMDSIAKQMNKVVKKQGLVVFGENEDLQGIDKKTVAKCMENNGFKKYILCGEEVDNIWVKVEDLNVNE